MSRRDPYAYLRAADDMLVGDGAYGPAAIDGGWWPKACAGLIRLALETAIDDYWLARIPAVVACRARRTKLLMLRRFLDANAARRASYAWTALSRITHYQCYDTPPSAVELRRLHTTVHTLLGQLAHAAMPQQNGTNA